MKKNLTFLISIFILFVLIYWSAKFFKSNYHQDNDLFSVIKIIDWDTIKIKYNWNLVNIRMIGIDAPERTKTRYGYIECFGQESTNYLTQILSWQKVKLELDKSQGKRDKYWRLLAYVILSGQNINKRMIEDGYAREYTFNTSNPYKEQLSFEDAEKYASESLVWLWSTDACSWSRLIIE